MTENDIQKFIWNHKDELHKYIEPPTFPEKYDHEKPWEYTPYETVYNLILESYIRIWKMIQELHLFGCEVHLNKTGDATIRTDFLGCVLGDNGLVIVELKKGEHTERQAFTELLAYGSHLRTLFAPMGKSDIIYLLISPMQERIVREAAVNTLLYDRNKIFVFVPTCKNDDINTLRLKPWIPSFDDIKNIVEANFSQSNFEVFKVAWDAVPGVWSPKKRGDSPTNEMIHRLNSVSAYAAQIMEAKGVHGFVFASQGYTDSRSAGYMLNSLIIGGINPYKATKNRHFVHTEGMSLSQADRMDMEGLSLSEIITSLKGTKNYREETDLLFTMSSAWYGELISIGFDVVRTLTTSIKEDSIRIDYGSFDWDTYQLQLSEDVMCHNLDMRLTGILRETFIEYSKRDYEYIKSHGYEGHPQHYHGDIPEYLVDFSTHQYFVREFLHRLFHPSNSADFCFDEHYNLDNEWEG